MVAFDGSGRCGRAEAYYQDFLEDESRTAVPRDVIDHICACKRCQECIRSLREILESVEGGGPDGASARDWRLIGELRRHFGFLGEHLSCAGVKPFLPGLLDPSLHIRIPTPITVHVDHCAACASDLESLRELELDVEQRAKLSRLYADAAQPGVIGSRRLRSQMRGLDPRACAIAERADSGVITVCTRRQEGQGRSAGIEGELYQDYPIRVQVLGRREEAGDGRGGSSRRLAFSRTSPPYAKIAIFAAAMIPLVLVFALSNGSATGLPVGQLGDAMAEVQYAQVSSLHLDGEKETGRQVWIIGRQEVIVLEQQAQANTVLDPGENETSTVARDSTSREVAILGLAEAEGIIENYLGSSIYEVPRGYALVSQDVRPAEETSGVDVYTLVARRSSLGGEKELYEEWRFYVDRVEKRLQSKEFRNGGGREAERRLYRTDTYEYLDEAEFQQHLSLARSRK